MPNNVRDSFETKLSPQELIKDGGGHYEDWHVQRRWLSFLDGYHAREAEIDRLTAVIRNAKIGIRQEAARYRNAHEKGNISDLYVASFEDIAQELNEALQPQTETAGGGK